MELTEREIEKFEAYLRYDEREPATIEAYLRSLRKFAGLAGGRTVMKELASAWKVELVASGYADAYSRFYADMLNVGAMVFNEEFEQSVSMKVSFVPMMHQTNEGEIFAAEKATFDSLPDFLWTEFYRGLALGNAPRRCHNCGKYFLLTKGYNTCYCGNIASGETERTCRKVGAHRKEAQGKSNRSPAHVEYDRAYNRLKQKKNRGKISVDE